MVLLAKYCLFSIKFLCNLLFEIIRICWQGIVNCLEALKDKLYQCGVLFNRNL